MTIRVLIADDNRPILDGLQMVLTLAPDLRVVAVTEHAKVAVQLVDELVPDVVVLDRSMPDLDGVDAARAIKARHPEVQIVMLTAHGAPSAVRCALDAGASGYVIKGAAFEELAVAIRAVAARKLYLSPAVAGTLLS